MTPSPGEVSEQLVALLPRLRRFARTLARNPHDADDVVQLALERALTRIGQWRPDTKLESWMFGIIRNAWIDEVRARKRHDAVLAPEELGEHVGETTTDAEIHRMALEAALSQLPEEQRSAVALVLIEGLSYKEAAEAMDVPIGTLTSRLARGRDALTALLAK